MAIRRLALTVAFTGVLAIALSGCGNAPMPVPTYEPSSTASPTPSPTPTAKVPKFHPDGTAAANQQYFDYINAGLQRRLKMSDSQTIVNTLVAAGFVKADMEVTDGATALNIPADAIQVSVKIQGVCLIGQFSNSGYAGIIAPLLGSGNCLVGNTITIDW